MDNFEWLLVALAFIALFLGVVLSLGVLFVACVWKPEHAYAGLLRVRRIFVGRHEVAPSGWRSA